MNTQPSAHPICTQRSDDSSGSVQPGKWRPDTTRDAELEREWGDVVRQVSAAKRRNTGPRQLYLIHAEGTALYKIGVAVNAEIRRATLQRGFPYRLRVLLAVDCNDGLVFTYERQAHKLLAARRMNGEWFAFKTEADYYAAVNHITRCGQEQTQQVGGSVGNSD